MEVISEAVRQLPDEMLLRYPHIEWRKIKAVGNVLRHEYHRINERIIWDVVQIELDSLETVIRSEIAVIARRDWARTSELHPRLNTRVGCSAPFSIRPSAMMRPLATA